MTKTRRIGFRVAIAIAVAATAVVMFWRWPLAWVPALLAAIVVCIEVLVTSIERRARSESKLPPMPAETRDRVVHAAEEKVGVRTGLAIGGGLLAIAVVIAGTLLGWNLIGLGAFVVFAWLCLAGLPMWIATVEEEIETEHDQLTGEPRSIH